MRIFLAVLVNYFTLKHFTAIHFKVYAVYSVSVFHSPFLAETSKICVAEMLSLQIFRLGEVLLLQKIISKQTKLCNIQKLFSFLKKETTYILVNILHIVMCWALRYLLVSLGFMRLCQPMTIHVINTLWRSDNPSLLCLEPKHAAITLRWTNIGIGTLSACPKLRHTTWNNLYTTSSSSLD